MTQHDSKINKSLTKPNKLSTNRGEHPDPVQAEATNREVLSVGVQSHNSNQLQKTAGKMVKNLKSVTITCSFQSYPMPLKTNSSPK